ncbi:uncharacterized protein LOC124366460 [Homalodisca vitripennis]|nr:uncharacterized protein LOC124366460 [Homalodisca vitripennis]
MPPVARLPSSSYWIPPSRRPSGMNSTATSSTTDSADSTPRNYVDPWDLENYAYLRRHCADLEDSDPVVSLSTNGLDSAHSDFYFVPARQPLTPLPPPQRGVMVRRLHRPSLIVAPEDTALVEEEDFYNARCEVTPCCHQRLRRQSCCQQHMASFHPGMYEKAKARQLTTAEEPPPLVYVYQTPRLHRKSSRQVREYIQPISTSSEENEGLYDELISLARQRKPQHFGLSSFGHLKIDYSCNWNNLDRYIGHT